MCVTCDFFFFFLKLITPLLHSGDALVFKTLTLSQACDLYVVFIGREMAKQWKSHRRL